MLIRFARYLFLVLCWAGLCSCTTNDSTLDLKKDVSSLPDNVKLEDIPTKILVLGNSYSYDAIRYLRELVQGAGISPDLIDIFHGVQGGAGISFWVGTYELDTPFRFRHEMGSTKIGQYVSVREMLNHNWDIVVFLQASDKSYQWENFEGVIDQFITMVSTHCPNKSVKLMYGMPWGHTRESCPKEIRGNIECAKRIFDTYGIQVIPTGTAIQNARNTRICNDTYLTRDNWHLNFGIGCYIAACTYYEALFSSALKRPVVSLNVNHPLSDDEISSNGAMPVDDSNRLLCQMCASRAWQEPFSVCETIETESIPSAQ